MLEQVRGDRVEQFVAAGGIDTTAHFVKRTVHETIVSVKDGGGSSGQSDSSTVATGHESRLPRLAAARLKGSGVRLEL